MLFINTEKQWDFSLADKGETVDYSVVMSVVLSMCALTEYRALSFTEIELESFKKGPLV